MSANQPDIQQIRKYLNGELDARAMFELERQAQTDPFWMDVLQGMESADEDHQPKLEEIDEFLKNRVPQEKKAVVPIWRTFSVAASVLIALSIGGWWLVHNTAKPVSGSNRIAAKIAVPPGKLKSGQPPLAIKPVDTQAEHKINLTKLTPGKLTHATIIAQASPQAAAAAAPVAGRAKTDTGNYVAAAGKVALTQYGYSNAPAANYTDKLSANSTKAKSSDTAGYLKRFANNTLKEEPISTKPDTLPRQVLMSKVAGVEIKMPENDAAQNISGKIVEMGTGNPIADAAIRIAGKEMAARSAADGTFKMSAAANGQTLEVNSIGYQGKRVNVSGLDSLNIALAPDNNSLNEVVVTRGSSPMHKIVENKSAHPVIGWAEYKKYLTEKATVSDDKKANVKLLFTVDAGGLISNMQIITGSAAELNQKAMNLILNGPKWVGAINGKTEKVKLTVKFHK